MCTDQTDRGTGVPHVRRAISKHGSTFATSQGSNSLISQISAYPYHIVFWYANCPPPSCRFRINGCNSASQSCVFRNLRSLIRSSQTTRRVFHTLAACCNTPTTKPLLLITRNHSFMLRTKKLKNKVKQESDTNKVIPRKGTFQGIQEKWQV